ncbi:MAG: UDP-N-acetylmuramoyl-L-alanine--D-glutamate ligase [Candidatus Pacebacteria bacterium CG10_big_fil_rev_8_21_14_0_10_36_11]|nr:UDP-N-acetylmuramoyl-L-alanine--D-glutamate ligase [Candidatus Pacearchaeota archaeon]OIP73970.1 MAG: UDP-N-acetylmuramoylalanine--D-glutamate ligase [Candidatus Pacebacteria bacterium CG2_30_36_39]PIR64391.1 MAG: UDP-N-acetylmuramoyl-L-alanine--D-glutamate ligase [Candidatus Pacebacteria bacterium CG10_big_fil_rev_8_21_14_0_10_36_11]PJC42782.1 MAG: UDP-N-acetylmuramoyl-L-alanine--D-glutamate ligase [Candidatus Pacebacteria bacterium CG_4_9_14_0_2_um_filter_36_8]
MNTKDSSLLKVIETTPTIILGMGREGWSTYLFLRKKFPNLQLGLADRKPLEKFSAQQQEILNNDKNLSLHFGPDHLSKLSAYKLIFKSPGIPQTTPEIAEAIRSGGKLTSHLQLFFELCSGITIGITGTKGKSTTSALIHHVLQTNDLNTQLVGNIGQPALDLLPEINSDSLVVCELSSHQLETLTISPHIAVVQNVTSEHLDYYADTTSYQQAKMPITQFQSANDFVIFNPEFKGSSMIAQLSAGKHLRFSTTEGPDAVVFVRNGIILRKDQLQRTEEILPINKLPLRGEHNVLNAMPAIIVGTIFNLSAEQIRNSLESFKSLPHRLEFVLERKNTSYFDDSLSTMPDAAIKALESFNGPVVLIAGGYERQQDFVELAKTILDKNVVGLILFQPTGKRLEMELKKLEPLLNEEEISEELVKIEFAESMIEAVGKAQYLMEKYLQKQPTNKGTIILSPASASFGMFKDYQDRGEQFKEAVKNLVL